MITLEAINSPFVKNTDGKPPNINDLIIALRVCSTKSWVDAVKTPSFFDKIKFNKLYIDIESLKIAFSQFAIYIKESTSSPKLWIKSNNQDGSRNDTNVKNTEGVPATLSIVVALMSKFNFNEHDAWNLAYCRALWYSIGFSSQEGGDIKIITTEEEENAEADKAKLDEIEKQAKEKYKNNG